MHPTSTLAGNGKFMLLLLLSFLSCAPELYEPQFIAHEKPLVKTPHRLSQPKSTPPELAKWLNRLDDIHEWAENDPYEQFPDDISQDLENISAALIQYSNDPAYAVHLARSERMKAWNLQNTWRLGQDRAVLQASIDQLESSKTERNAAFDYELSYHYNLIAYSYSSVLQYDKSIAYYEKSLAINLDRGLYTEALKDYASLMRFYHFINEVSMRDELAAKCKDIRQLYAPEFKSTNDLSSLAFVDYCLAQFEFNQALSYLRINNIGQAKKSIKSFRQYTASSQQLLNELDISVVENYQMHIDLQTTIVALTFWKFDQDLPVSLDSSIHRIKHLHIPNADDETRLLLESILLFYQGALKQAHHERSNQTLHRKLRIQIRQAHLEFGSITNLWYAIESARTIADYEYFLYTQTGKISHLKQAAETINIVLEQQLLLERQTPGEHGLMTINFQRFYVSNTANAINLALQQSGTGPQGKRQWAAEALLLSDLSKSHVLEHQLKQKKQLPDDHWSGKANEFLAAVQQKLLNDQSAALDLHFGVNEIIVTAITKEDLLQYRVSPTQNLANANAMIHHDSTMSLAKRRAAYLLYEKVLQPAFDWFTSKGNIQHIYFTPDREFSHLNLERIPTKKPSKNTFWNQCELLIERFSISYNYSLSIALLQKQLSNQKQPTDGWGIFGLTAAIILPDSNRIPPLKRFDTFVDTLSSGLIQHDKSYQANLNCTLVDFSSQAKQKSVVAIFGHGYSDPFRSNQYYLQFRPTEKNPSGLMKAGDFDKLALDCDLLLAINCDSGDGQSYSFEGRKSIGREFLASGSLAVIAGAGDLPEASTVEVLHYFMQYWKAGGTAAQALRKAKLRYLNAHPTQPSPTNWSNLIYLGLPDIYF